MRSRNIRSNQGTLNFNKDVKSELPGSRVTFRQKEKSESQFFLTETPQMYKSPESIHNQAARTSRIRGKKKSNIEKRFKRKLQSKTPILRENLGSPLFKIPRRRPQIDRFMQQRTSKILKHKKIYHNIKLEDFASDSESDNNLLNTPKKTEPKKDRMRDLTEKLIPTLNRRLYTRGRDTPPSDRNLLSGLKDKFEDRDDYEVINDMVSDAKGNNNFRSLERVFYTARESITDDPLLNKKFDELNFEDKANQSQKDFFKFQTSYIEKCKKMGVLPLPLAKKIKYDGLAFDNYPINRPISKALGRSMNYLNTNIKSINLTNCNMDDKAISYIIKGMIYNPIESLIIQNNVVGEKSIQALIKAINISHWNCKIDGREAKTRIRHLELNKCIPNSSLMNVLMRELSKNRMIENLRLSSVDFNTESITHLAEFVMDNFSFQSLNLSWSEISSKELILFFTLIENVKHLQQLDISTIPFIGYNSGKLVELLKKHIINNPSLIHLNISSCNLGIKELKILYEGIKKSKSLLAVHLSGNIKRENLRNIASNKPNKIGKAPFSKKDTLSRNRIIKYKSDICISRRVDHTMQERLDRQKRQALMFERYKQSQRRKLGFIKERKTKFETTDSRIILYRFLGHIEILDGHKWKSSTSCWICDKWKYTCIIANPLTAHANFKNSSEFNCGYYHQKIIDNNSPEELKLANSVEIPTITGTFSQWKLHKMIRIDKFYDCLLRNKLPSKRIYVKEEKNDLTTRISKILNNEIYTTYRNVKGFVTRKRPTIIEKIIHEKFAHRFTTKTHKRKSVKKGIEEIMEMRFENLGSIRSKNIGKQKVIKCIQRSRIFNIIFRIVERARVPFYKSGKFGAIYSSEVFSLMKKEQPHFIIEPDEIGDTHKRLVIDQPEIDNEEISQYYLYATFMPPGDSKFIVSFDGTKKDSFHFIQAEIPAANQEILLHKKRIRKRLLIRQFNVHNSIFKDWKPDTPETLKMSLDCDFSHSRIKKFIKGQEEYDTIYSMFYNNIARIKEIFNYSIGVSSYPYISFLEFGKLAHMWNIPDKGTCPMSVIDTVFITTNYEEVNRDQNPEKLLCRYEFYEILIRIAYHKYILSKTCKNLPAAVSRLLTDNIFNNSEHVFTGQRWRKDELWLMEIDDLYMANITSLKTVFQMFKHKHYNYWLRQDTIRVCNDKLDINIDTQNIQLAFSLCKMTVVDEMEEHKKLERIDFAEFIEFIARIGQIVFIKNKTMSLYDKIVYIMQKFFALIPAEVIYPNTDILVESESDEDEFQ
ncbi:unnamed protein product [Moneuplotes crassus]|uniref:Uncharacterized protein n=1 Tax=Euplotes crassus TaxID=5936 RepID=A0AAD1Y3D8_EUPCR|nr:unnamed protein product [Moneuplotes crassus]